MDSRINEALNLLAGFDIEGFWEIITSSPTIFYAPEIQALDVVKNYRVDPVTDILDAYYPIIGQEHGVNPATLLALKVRYRERRY